MGDTNKPEKKIVKSNLTGKTRRVRFLENERVAGATRGATNYKKGDVATLRKSVAEGLLTKKKVEFINK